MRFHTMIWLTLAATLALVSPTSAAVNLLTNGDFEASGGSLDGWFVDDPTTVGVSSAATDSIFLNGAAAAKLSGKDLAGCNGPDFQNSLIKQAFVPTGGKEYEFSGWSYMSSSEPIIGTDICASNRAVAQISFFFGTTKISQNEVLIAFDGFPTDTWVPFTITLPAPSIADGVEASIIFLKPGCDVGDAVYVDDLFFCELTPIPSPDVNLLANPSFDNGFLDWITFDNVVLVSSGGGFQGAESQLVRTAERSAKLYSSFLSPPSPSGMFQSFPATPGAAYRMEVYSMHTCADGDQLTGTQNYMVAQVLFRDSIGDAIFAGEDVILDASSPLGTWEQHEIYAWAPPAAASVDVFILFFSPANQGGSGKVDDLRFEQLSNTTAAPMPADQSLLRLHQNFPNPVNRAMTRIAFDLARPEPVEISIYDVVGRQVATVFEGNLEAGPHSVTWDRKTRNGARAAAGVYRYVMKTPSGTVSRSLVLTD